jgi:hypothetical protein
MSIILKGTPEINSTDVSGQVMEIMFSGSRDSINIPATFGQRASFAAGNDTYEVTIRFLQGVTATDVSEILFAAMGDTTGTITVGATMKAGAVDTDNPKYEGTAVVTDWDIGGEVNSVGQTSVTLPLTDRPTKAVS